MYVSIFEIETLSRSGHLESMTEEQYNEYKTRCSNSGTIFCSRRPDGQIYVVAGHSRLMMHRAMGRIQIPVRFVGVHNG